MKLLDLRFLSVGGATAYCTLFSASLSFAIFEGFDAVVVMLAWSLLFGTFVVVFACVPAMVLWVLMRHGAFGHLNKRLGEFLGSVVTIGLVSIIVLSYFRFWSDLSSTLIGLALAALAVTWAAIFDWLIPSGEVRQS